MTDTTAPALDPRISRTRRDVVDAAAALLVEQGWEAVTHAEVAKRAGYSRATVYAHWPHRDDLYRDAIEQICDEASHPPATGDLHADVHAALADFAVDLTVGHLDRLLAGVIERADRGDGMRGMRALLYETGTRPLRAVLAAHLPAADVELAVEILTGAVLARVSFAGLEADGEFLAALIERTLARR